jgi:membrane-associated protease RseP (regulator of RpoE activity)
MYKAILLAVTAITLFGCANQSVYKQWGDQLDEIPKYGSKVEDVSMLVGSPPTHCDAIKPGKLLLGIHFDTVSKTNIVSFVRDGTPANKAGIRKGDKIISINSQPVTDYEQVKKAFPKTLREGEPVNIVTDHGSYSVIPAVAKIEQCYWNISAGTDTKVGGANSADSTSQQFFRASCRIIDGYVTACNSDWQD